MKIGFDVSQTGRRKAGCGYVADSIIREFARRQTPHEFLLYPTVGDVFWDPEWREATYSGKQKGWPRKLNPGTFEESQSFWRHPPADFEQLLGSPDIVQVNNFYCPSGLRHARLVYFLHDLLFLDHPDWTTESNRIACFHGVFDASLRADAIVANSKFSRDSFLATFPHYPSARIHVAPLGSRFAGAARAPATAAVYGLTPGRFWLTVGTLEPRKNLPTLLRAYERVREADPDPLPLVLTGGEGWHTERILPHLNGLESAGHIVRTGYVSDEKLQWLYENCHGFLFPSFAEGFGMPVLEAMSVGAGVICSNATVLPEIAGEAGLYADPNREGEWVEVMLRFRRSAELRDQMRARSREHAAQYSWSKTADLLLQVYEVVTRLPPLRSKRLA
jgi:glycosyltransferase involved in cell wall biosynthesis